MRRFIFRKSHTAVFIFLLYRSPRENLTISGHPNKNNALVGGLEFLGDLEKKP